MNSYFKQPLPFFNHYPPPSCWPQSQSGLWTGPDIFSYYKFNRRLNICKKVILRHLLSVFWLHLVYNGWLDSSQNRDSKCLRIHPFVLWSLSTILNLFPFLTCLHTFIFDPYSLFLKFVYDLVCLVICGHISGQHVWVVMLFKPFNMLSVLFPWQNS